jgi:D-aspartate ligase
MNGTPAAQMYIKDKSVPVVVLVSSQHGGLGIIRSLGREGIPIYGVHQSKWEPAAHSRFLQRVFVWDFSSAAADNSVKFLLELAQTIGKRPVLIPTSDVTAGFVAGNAGRLADQYLLATPSAEVVHQFSCKKRTHDLCRKLGVPTAVTALVQSKDEALDFARTWNFPIIVKGPDGAFRLRKNGTGRVAIVRGEEELLNIFDLNSNGRDPGLILQEYIAGGDATVWMFNGYFNEESECLFGATGRKLRQFPAHRGSTSLGICEKNEAVEAQTARLMEAVRYRGPLDMGYRFDARGGQYKLLDVNPRIGSTFRLFAAENGLDVSRVLYLHLTQQTIPRSRVREGRKWIVENNDLVSSLRGMREGELTPCGWLRSLRGVQERAWLAWDDLAPLAMLPLLLRRKQFPNGRT